MPTRKDQLPPLARWAWIGARRLHLRARSHFREHSVWPLATATGAIGIILLLLMQLSLSTASGQSGTISQFGDVDGGSNFELTDGESSSWDEHYSRDSDAFTIDEEPPAAAPAPIQTPEPEVPEIEIIEEYPIDDPAPAPGGRPEPWLFDSLKHLREPAPPLENIDPEPAWDHEPAPLADPPELEVDISRVRTPDDSDAAGAEFDEEFHVESDAGTLRLDQRDLSDFPTDDWQRFDMQRLGRKPATPAYQGLPPDADDERYRDERQPVPHAPEQSKELAVSIHKVVPDEASTDTSYDYQIIVRNDGASVVEEYNVEERIGRNLRVLNAYPDAIYENGALYWKLRNLQPGREQTLTVTVVAVDAGATEPLTILNAGTNVGAGTEVQGPRLLFDVYAPQRVQVGEALPIRFRVTNASSVEVADVVIEDDLSDELMHRGGRELGYKLGTLAPGETREARLVARAEALGSATNVARVAVNHSVVDEVSSIIQVAEAVPQADAPTQSRPQTPTPARIYRPAPVYVAPGPPMYGPCQRCW